MSVLNECNPVSLPHLEDCDREGGNPTDPVPSPRVRRKGLWTSKEPGGPDSSLVLTLSSHLPQYGGLKYEVCVGETEVDNMSNPKRFSRPFFYFYHGDEFIKHSVTSSPFFVGQSS